MGGWLPTKIRNPPSQKSGTGPFGDEADVRENIEKQK